MAGNGMGAGFTRRSFLGGAMAAAAGATLAPRLVADAALTAFLNRPGSLPFPGRPAGVPQPDLAPELAGIEHIFLLMQENKSFDAYFGMLPYSPVTAGRLAGRVDGFRHLAADGRPTDIQQDKDGKRYRAFPMQNSCATARPDVSWDYSHHAYNNGKMDAFVSYHSGEAAMGFWHEDVLPTYYSLASHFPVGDRYFSSTLGSTDPNRVFSICASAVGVTDTQRPSPSNPTNLTQVRPPNGHIFEVLDHYDIDWLTIAGNLPTVGLIGGGYPERHAGTNILLTGSNDNAVLALEAVLATGQVPPVVTVEPDFIYGSEENANDIGLGEYFIYRVVKAIVHSRVWERSLIIFSYDESGGYYEHVTPPAALSPGDGTHPNLPQSQWFGDDYNRYGFRVPNLVISPWAKADHVSHVVRDHTSTLRTIAAKWNLPALTFRDANASDFRECLVPNRGLSIDHAPFAHPPALAASPPRSILDSINCQQHPARAGAFPPASPPPAHQP